MSTGSISTFVVRYPAGWMLGEGDQRQSRPIELDEVIERFVGPEGVAIDPEIVPHSPWSWVAPQNAFVARVTDRGLYVEGGGASAILDALDLRVLDAVSDGVQTAEVALRIQEDLSDEAPPTEDLLRRLRRLTDLHRLRLIYEDPNPFVPDLVEDLEDLEDLEDVVEEREPEPEAAVEVDASPASPPPPAPRPLWKRAAKKAKREVSARQFPGRDALRDAYRSVRPLPATPTPEPVVEVIDVADEAAPTEDTEMLEGTPAQAETETITEAEATETETDAEAEPHRTPTEEWPEPGAPRVDPAIRYVDDPRVGDPVPGAVPVYAVFQAEIGPPLSLAMLTAAARHHDDGALNAHFEIRRQEDVASFLDDLAGRTGPAIMLCSNYVWSAEANLNAARRAKAINPDLLVIHGGPSTPKYAGDAERYFAEHPDIVDVTVRAEGELALCEVLEALGRALPAWDLRVLAGVNGISYRDPETGAMVRTEDRERNATLDDLPSPYLSGEFDHLHPTVWDRAYVIFETNRGCPYGCTFCDWGSSTLSRIRKFTLDRVAQEMEWAAVRKLPSWVVADANLGIMSRDVEVVDFMARQRELHGAPVILGFNVAKNTTKHLTAIVERLVEVGIAPHVSLALQTRDEGTLNAVHRQNISTDHYVAMAASFRRNGLPLQADLMLGLPGQTPESIRGDLQFLLEHEVPLRIWITQLLPNSPMNDPEYREEWAIRADENGVVMETASFTIEDRTAMMRLRYAHTVFERFGLLRHIMRYAWWDHDIAATEIMQRAIDRTQDDPESYPLINWVLRFFDFYPVPPVGWASFYEEVRRFLEAEFSLSSSPELDTVLALQQFLMPDYGRELPEQIELAHDYVSYYQDATKGLWIDGHATGAPRPLSAYGPRTFTVYGDPMNRNSSQMRLSSDPRNETMTDEFWMSGHFELDSPLVMNYAEVAAHGGFVGLLEQVPDGVDLTIETPVPRRNPIPVSIGTRQGSLDGVDTFDED